mmetsp:Transcript_13976/g.34438  ORF Transcript_13976/g.34438 Transcript_13976/m.34438 type:complete len:237 (+) Transcript_13976:2488-3198(+)
MDSRDVRAPGPRLPAAPPAAAAAAATAERCCRANSCSLRCCACSASCTCGAWPRTKRAYSTASSHLTSTLGSYTTWRTALAMSCSAGSRSCVGACAWAAPCSSPAAPACGPECTRQPSPNTAAARISGLATVSSCTSRSAAPSRMAMSEISGMSWHSLPRHRHSHLSSSACEEEAKGTWGGNMVRSHLSSTASRLEVAHRPWPLGWPSQMAASTKAACARECRSTPPSMVSRYLMK